MSDRSRGKRAGRGGGSPATPHVPPSQQGGEHKPKKSKEESNRKGDKPRPENAEPLDRLQFINLNLLVRTKDGSLYEGIYGGSVSEGAYGVVIKFARKIEDRSKLVHPPLDSLTIKAADFVELIAREVDFNLSGHTAEKHRAGGFRTDTEISGGYDGGERELQRWTPDNDDQGLMYDLLNRVSRDTFGATASRGWDQFSVNEKLYGYQSTYREELYTTELDKNSAAYRSRIEHASRIADEIERGVSRNIHMQEERGHIPTGGDEVDEEDRYGAVIRHPEQGGTEDKYVPPNKRGAAAASSATAAPAEATKPQEAGASAPIPIGGVADRVTPPNSPLGSSPSSPKLHRRESDPKLNPLTLLKGESASAGDAKAKPLQSPLVGDPVVIQSLALEVVAPKVSEEVHKKFEEYQARNRPGKEETIADLKKAKETLENSSPRLRSLSSSGGNPALPQAATPAANPLSPSSSSSSLSSSSGTVPVPASPSAAATTPSAAAASPSPKLASKLNPNAKVFTPLSAKAAPFVPKNMPPSPAAASAAAASSVASAMSSHSRPAEPQLADIYNESAQQRLKAVHNMNDAAGAEHVSPSWPHGRPTSYKSLSAEEEQRLLIRQEQHVMYGARMPIPYIPPQALPPNSAQVPQVIYVPGPGGYPPRGPPYFVPAPMSPPTMVSKGAARSGATPASPKGGVPPGSPPYASPPQNVVMMGGYQQPVLVRPYGMPMDDLKSPKSGGRPVSFDPSQFAEVDPAYQQQLLARHAAVHGGAGFPAFAAADGAPEVVHGFAVPNTDALPSKP